MANTSAIKKSVKAPFVAHFSELNKGAVVSGSVGGEAHAMRKSMGVAIAIAFMFALTGIWLLREIKKSG